MRTVMLYQRLLAAQTRILNRHRHDTRRALPIIDGIAARWREWLWGFRPYTQTKEPTP
jgi:hypothetical protein